MSLRLREATRKATTSNQLAQHLEDLQTPDENDIVETRWYQLREAVHTTALGVLGCAGCQHQDWFDENDADIGNLIVEQNRFHRAHFDCPTDANEAAFHHCRRLAQQRSREMRETLMARKAEGSRADLSRTASQVRWVRVLTGKSQILKRWAEYFRCVLNNPSTISYAAIDRFPHVELNVDPDLPHSLLETTRVVPRLSSGKAPGSDSTPAEI
ncbi:hypothetical protein SprV_0100515400 [Sparganum proliferum]